MHVSLGGFVLFLHIAAAITAFVMAGLIHVAAHHLAHARTVAEMRPWAAIAHRLEPLFPVTALLLLGLGAWLIHLSGGEFRWSDGWIITAVTTLVVIEGLAGATLAPAARRLVESVERTPDGPVPVELHRATLNPGLWYVGHIATCGFAAVVFLMAAKPSGAWSPVIVAIGVAVGVALAGLQLRAVPAAWAAPAGAVPAQRQAADAESAVTDRA